MHYSHQFDNLILLRVKLKTNQSSPAKPVWQKTHYSNLLRYVPSGSYFARIRVGGKRIRRSLGTVVLSVAKLKLADLEKEERVKLENYEQFASGKVTFSDLLTEYRTRLEANHSMKTRTRTYYSERVEANLIPTVSRWLGHEDGGALAMKVYGHLRDQHSVNMAQKVTFSAQV